MGELALTETCHQIALAAMESLQTGARISPQGLIGALQLLHF